MSTDDYVFTSEEIAKIKKYRDKQKDSRLKIRFIALLLISKRIDICIIASIIGKSRKTIEKWFRIYIFKGIDYLNSFKYKHKQEYLTNGQVMELIKWIKENRPSNIKIIHDFIRNSFCVTYTLDAVRKLIKRHGLKLIRPKSIPGDPPSEQEQLDFIDKYTELRSFEGLGVAVLFCDAMHLIHQAVPCFYWGDPGDKLILKTNSGRKRLNIIGAYDPSKKRLIHITDEDNCDSKKIISFFEKLLISYPKKHSIVVILDNAPYFHSKDVVQWLENNPKIICQFLPTYAPNLNLIERLWRFAKDKLVRNTYYKKYKTFRCNVFRFLNNISKYSRELNTLMVEKFEIISN